MPREGTKNKKIRVRKSYKLTPRKGHGKKTKKKKKKKKKKKNIALIKKKSRFHPRVPFRGSDKFA